MPNLESKTLCIWPTYCNECTIVGTKFFSTASDANVIFQLLSGNARVNYKDRQYTITARDIVMIGRDRQFSICPMEGVCTIIQLEFAHAKKAPSFDLNHLCLRASSVDTFFGLKTRFCTFPDRAQVHITLQELHNELSSPKEESETFISSMMTELFIKLARCFFAQDKSAGVPYLNKAREYIKLNYQRSVTVDEICSYAAVSRSYLSDLFNRYLHRSIVTYINQVRCDKAASLLTTTNFSTVDIALESGFTNRQHFSRTFTQLYGVTPSEYRKGYRV